MNVNGEDEREFDSEAVFWGQWQVCKNETESEKKHERMTPNIF